VTERGLTKARELGLRTLVYTVNEPARLRTLQANGVDGVFTDRPGLARETLAGRPG
jgi:glycerophosphoryl diester phosphodiesterase